MKFLALFLVGQWVRSESAKRSLIWLHSRNVTKNQHYWHESPYMFLNTMEIKIFNITIFSFCESNNPPYKIFSLCENSELHWNLWIFWSYSLWANVSGQRSRSDYWTDYIQGMGPKFHNFRGVRYMYVMYPPHDVFTEFYNKNDCTCPSSQQNEHLQTL